MLGILSNGTSEKLMLSLLQQTAKYSIAANVYSSVLTIDFVNELYELWRELI